MRIVGNIEVVSRNSISGWIAVVGTAVERPRLELLLDGAIIGWALADGMREDVAAHGLGDGKCGFNIVLPTTLTEAEIDRAQLRVGDSELLLNLPKVVGKNARAGHDAVAVPASPVFVVGSPRSGTSALARALSAAGYLGYEEGNLLGLGQILEERVDWYFKAYDATNAETLLGNVDKEDLKEKFFDVFKNIFERLNPTNPWFDKTGNPEAILLLPRMMSAWPTSRVIFARRRGIENIISRMQKFPERDFAYHCRDWSANMAAWRHVRGQLNVARITEVDQQEMLDQPKAVAERLSTLLSLPAAATAKIEHVFTRERPQESFPGSAQRLLSFEETGWSDNDISTFINLCAKEMSEYNYSYH
jgi:hypothetical protein